MKSQHDRQIARESQLRRAQVLFAGTHTILTSRFRAVAKTSIGNLRDLADALSPAHVHHKAIGEACERLAELVTLCDDMDLARKQWREVGTEITYEEIADTTGGVEP